MTPRLLVIGHVTRDELLERDGQRERLGGAASFATLAGARLGCASALVTAAPAGHPLLAPLLTTPGVRVAQRDAGRITSFRLDYRTGARRLWLTARAPALTLAEVPDDIRAAPIVYLGPVAGECAPALAAAFPGAFVIAGLQGWLRSIAPDGEVGAIDAGPDGLPAVAAELPGAVGLASLSALDHPAARPLARRLAGRGILTAVTRGASGATLFLPSAHGGGELPVAASPVDVEVDPTGAGDVFALVLGLALAAGSTPAAAGQAAARAAARVVEGPGLGRL